MVVLCVATLWVTTKNAPFSDRNKVFQAFLKTFEIASSILTNITPVRKKINLFCAFYSEIIADFYRFAGVG